VRVPVVASGGAGTLQHLADALGAGAHAVLAASIFHFRTHSVAEAKAYLAARGFPMRSVDSGPLTVDSENAVHSPQSTVHSPREASGVRG
jgi:thiazole synthase ThiGH ThiG subunit